MKKTFILAIMFLIATPYLSFAESKHKHDADKPHVYFIEPKDGDIISGPIYVKMGAMGIDIVPAGTDKENSGHHHLLIDVKKYSDFSSPVPKDANHKHFGKGQLETTLNLAPGKHTLQLLVGDKAHVPHSPPVMSEKITITVK